MASISWWGLRHKRIGESLFLPKDDRRRSPSAAHGEGAYGDSGAWRSGRGQRVHADSVGPVWRTLLEACADHAGGTHSLAAVVSNPSLTHVLLGAHGHRAVAGLDDAATAGA